MHTYYSKSYLREVRTFEASIQWKKIGHGRQTVGQRAGVSQLPGARQKSRRGYLPLLDGAGKKQIKQCLGSKVHRGKLKGV